LRPARAVQREHQLLAEAGAKRVRLHEGREPRGDVAVAAERELEIREVLLEVDPEPVELGRDRAGCRGGEIAERFAAPEAERTLDRLRPGAGVARLRGTLRRGAQPGHHVDVDGLVRHPEQVAAGARLEDPRRLAGGPCRLERAPQLRDRVVQRRLGRVGRLVVPERRDQPRARHDGVPPVEQHREQESLARPAQVGRGAVDHRRERSEQGERDGVLHRARIGP
jgi:hypothetical protein